MKYRYIPKKKPYSYWMLLEVIGGYWSLLDVIGDYWRLFAIQLSNPIGGATKTVLSPPCAPQVLIPVFTSSK